MPLRFASSWYIDARSTGRGSKRPLSGRRTGDLPRPRSTSGRRGPRHPGSTIARWTPNGMNPIVFARTRAPWRTACGGIPWVMSMICVSGAMRFMTPWQVPTKSSASPKSLGNVMNTRGATTAVRLGRASYSASRAGRQRRTRSRRISLHRRRPLGRIRTKAVGTWAGAAGRRGAASSLRTVAPRDPRTGAHSRSLGRVSRETGLARATRCLPLHASELCGDDRDVDEHEDEDRPVRGRDVLACVTEAPRGAPRRSASSRLPASSTR